MDLVFSTDDLAPAQRYSAWRDAINFALQDMWQDGAYMNIYNKWYGPDTPYYFPMTEKIEMWP